MYVVPPAQPVRDDFEVQFALSGEDGLMQFRVHEIKERRVFVVQRGQARSDFVFLANTHPALQQEAISKLAEGIEDRAAWDALQAMGCHEGKGYFISKPLERTALIAWIRAYTL